MAKKETNTPKASPTQELIVIHRGWVLMGDVEPTDNKLLVTNAAVVRVWGTDAGLGQIALHGPTSRTVLDPCGKVDVPMHAVLFRIKCTY